MKNVTISMDDELYQATRIEAARAGKSMSKHIADLLRLSEASQDDEAEQRKLRLEALRRVFEGPRLPISENGRMPTADERNARR
jgi:plasmid stability protein